MCLRFGSCFGSGSRQDLGRSASKATHHGGGGGDRRADHGYYSGADHKSGPQADHHLQPATDETPRNNAGGHGGHTVYAQDKADNTLKHQAAWISKVGDDAGQNRTTRLQEDAAADPREHDTTDHHHYPTTTTTTTKARY